MIGKTSIEWATDTWPVITGCSPVSEGCRNCYGARLAATRLKHHPHYSGLATMVNGRPQWTGEVRFNRDVLEAPLRWKKPRVVFVCSMSDLFHEDVTNEQLAAIFNTMQTCNNHTFLLLTKRPGRMAEFWELWFDPYDEFNLPTDITLPNVWLGVTVETQDQMWRAVELLAIPAAKHFVSIEPCLGPVDLSGVIKALDGVIVGGESGPGARPMHPDWTRRIKDQCVAAGVPFTFKQHGEWLHGSEIQRWVARKFQAVPEGFADLAASRVQWDQKRHEWPDGTRSYWVSKKAAGRELDGKVWDEFPWDVISEEGQPCLT